MGREGNAGNVTNIRRGMRRLTSGKGDKKRLGERRWKTINFHFHSSASPNHPQYLFQTCRHGDTCLQGAVVAR